MKKIICTILILLFTVCTLTGCMIGGAGENGKSAYELAVEAGFEGSVNDWLDSLKGKDGAPASAPYIGDNNNWWVDGVDLGIKADGVDVINNSTAPLPMTGKSVLFLGDGFIAENATDDGIAALVGDITGADIYNCAISGSTAGQNKNTDMAAFSLPALVDALISEDFSSQTEALASLSSTDEYSSIAESIDTLESISIRSISCIILSYGYQDYLNETELTNESEASNGFSGALTYAITKLHSATSSATRIYVSTAAYSVYEDGGNSDDAQNSAGLTLKDYVDSCEDVAWSFKMTYIDNYNELGINSLNAQYFYDEGEHGLLNASGRERVAKNIANIIARI